MIFIYFFFSGQHVCVNACEVSVMRTCVSVHDAERLCLCANPQRYFNFGWMLKKHAVATALGVPAGMPGGWGVLWL